MSFDFIELVVDLCLAFVKTLNDMFVLRTTELHVDNFTVSDIVGDFTMLEFMFGAGFLTWLTLKLIKMIPFV